MLMAVAGSVSLLFSRLRWPKAIGYILAGVLLSGSTWGGSFLADERSVHTAGQIGVIFLMFSSGLSFSAARFKEVGYVAAPVAIADTLVMLTLGFAAGRTLFGWGTVPSLFLGAAICDSSTAILAKFIGELRWGDRPFARYALGVSVFEDVVCVAILALATGVAGGRGMDPVAIAESVGGLGVFAVAVFFFGLVLVPRLLTSVARRGDDEALLLALLGVCFFVTWVAQRLGFSIALGAFMIGVVGAGSDARERLLKLLEPLKTMFSAVFFVSAGLLVDPAECWRNLTPILGLSAMVVGCKFLNCTVAAVASGARVSTAVQSGMALAQTGEFAYMAALLYATLSGDAETPLCQIAIGVSIITTIASPVLVLASGRAGALAERLVPARAAKALDAYRGFLERYRTSGQPAKRRVARRSMLQLAACAVLVFATSVAFSMLDARDWSNFSRFFDAHKRLFFSLAMNAVIVGILAVAVRIAKSMAVSVAESIVGRGTAPWKVAVKSLARHVMMAIVFLLATVEIVAVNVSLAPAERWARVSIAVAFAAAATFGWGLFARAGRRAAKNFAAALRTDERLARLSREVSITVPEGLISGVAVPQDSPCAGMTVGALGIRAKTGVSVAAVDRDGRRIRNVGPSLKLRAGDVLVVMGEKSGVKQLETLLEFGT